MESEESMLARVVRVVTAFDKQTEQFSHEMKLSDVDLPMLQRLFNVEPDNPMYDCGEVGPVEAAALRDHVDGEIDLSRYDYFVECYLPRRRDEVAVSTSKTTAGTI